jgi:hypothetical protein
MDTIVFLGAGRVAKLSEVLEYRAELDRQMEARFLETYGTPSPEALEAAEKEMEDFFSCLS